MHEPLEVILVILGMSFWVLFPIGIFISVSHVDKNTDQVVQLEHLRHGSDPIDEQREEVKKARLKWRPNVVNVHYRRMFGH